MEYLYKVLGIKATVQRAEFDHLPNYIAVRYRLQKVSMDGQKVTFSLSKDRVGADRSAEKAYCPYTGKKRTCLSCWC